MSPTNKAHALSLPIFAILDKHAADQSTVDDIAAEIENLLDSLQLKGHLAVVRRETGPAISVTSTSEFGDSVMLELYSRCEFFPCPAGECKYASSNFCMWCSKLKV